ncbi:MAG TPA: response regulator [Terriglobales bacterium]|jgi:CheY-like chemotaxis protein|nr:response regulator [Terriglobales bacterium]
MKSHNALVVDDSMLIRHTVCRYLEERGFTVESACNGEEALAKLKDFEPEVIFTDLSMPRMTGGELLTVLKTNPRTARIPTVILAGKSSSNPFAAEHLATYVMYKDIDIEAQLRNALIHALGTDMVAVEAGAVKVKAGRG